MNQRATRKQIPARFMRLFTVEKEYVPGAYRSDRNIQPYRHVWGIKYKGEYVAQVDTQKAVRKFIEKQYKQRLCNTAA